MNRLPAEINAEKFCQTPFSSPRTLLVRGLPSARINLLSARQWRVDPFAINELAGLRENFHAFALRLTRAMLLSRLQFSR